MLVVILYSTFMGLIKKLFSKMFTMLIKDIEDKIFYNIVMIQNVEKVVLLS